MVGARRGVNLFFKKDNMRECIRNAQVIFISVNTPTKTHGTGEVLKVECNGMETLLGCHDNARACSLTLDCFTFKGRACDLTNLEIVARVRTCNCSAARSS